MRVVLALCAILPTVAGLGRTLADCEATAAKFKNTCDPSAGPIDLASHAGTDVVCTDDVQACAGTTTAPTTCTWQRKMCVTCEERSGKVYIRLQSNGLPMSCYKSPSQPVAQDNDFEVLFNPPATEMHSPTTQDEVNAILCEIKIHSNAPAASETTIKGSSSMNAVTGLSLDGVAYMNQMSIEGVDPFYPSVYGSVTDPSAVVEKVDMCLGHPQASGIYHYHTLSPCVIAPDSQPVQPCNARNGCDDFATHAISTYANPKELVLIGIAKDGHLMYGPYLADGSTAGDKGLDMCNGATGLADCDDSYAYFATTTFPYLTGCFGSGARPAFTPQCTDNAVSSYKPLETSCSTTDAPPTNAPDTAVPGTPTTEAPATPTPASPPTPPAGKPNFLLFMPDDFEYIDSWAEAPPGYDIKETPPTQHMDRIRNEGAIFTRAYTVGPKCAPSRFGLLTGRYSSRADVARDIAVRQNKADPAWDGRVNIDVPPCKISGKDSTENIQTALKKVGYETIHSGKWHLFKEGDQDGYLDDYPGFVKAVEATGFTTVASAYVTNMETGGAVDSKGYKWTHNYEWMVETSLAAVSTAVGAGKPFFLHYTPTGPHSPKFKEALDDFDSQDCPAGRLPTPPVTTMRTRQEVWDAAGLLTKSPAVQETLAAHMWVDDSLGALLEGIDGLGAGVLDNTLVLVVMDHGTAGKSTLIETGVRTMMAVRYPPSVPQGSEVVSVVTNADTASTFVEMAGTTLGYTGDGESWQQEVTGGGIPQKTIPKAMEMDLGRAIVAGRWKLLDDDNGEQLFDLTADPTEAKNLFSDMASAEKLKEMQGYLACHDQSTSALTGATYSDCIPPEIDNEFAPAVTDAPTEVPATDAPATDAPLTDAPATDAPATDAPATDAPATDAPATDAPATDAPLTDAPLTDAPATDAPATDAPATDAPATDAPATDAPATNPPATDIPVTLVPGKSAAPPTNPPDTAVPTDAPATDAPATDAPATDAPKTDAPATDAPATEAPPTNPPATDPPATNPPATDIPTTLVPGKTAAPPTNPPDTAVPTDAPATDAPATDAPATDAPATDAPKTNAPATNPPATDIPVTLVPGKTASPPTNPPDTAVPTAAPTAQPTVAPTTAPDTAIPETLVPGKTSIPTAEPTGAPDTDAPKTGAPATNAPATDAPTTDAPATSAPATSVPETLTPGETSTPTAVPTQAPETAAPTDAPPTDAPATLVPGETSTPTAVPTQAPTTAAPTDAPPTDAPATLVPGETSTPTAQPTLAPPTGVPRTLVPGETSVPTAMPTGAPDTQAPSTLAPGATSAPTVSPTLTPGTTSTPSEGSARGTTETDSTSDDGSSFPYWVLILIGAFVALAACAGGGYMMYKKKNDNERLLFKELVEQLPDDNEMSFSGMSEEPRVHSV